MPDLEIAMGTDIAGYIEGFGLDATIAALDEYVVMLEERRDREVQASSLTGAPK